MSEILLKFVNIRIYCKEDPDQPDIMYMEKPYNPARSFSHRLSMCLNSLPNAVRVCEPLVARERVNQRVNPIDTPSQLNNRPYRNKTTINSFYHPSFLHFLLQLLAFVNLSKMSDFASVLRGILSSESPNQALFRVSKSKSDSFRSLNSSHV